MEDDAAVLLEMPRDAFPFNELDTSLKHSIAMFLDISLTELPVLPFS